jgi:hypothetical protein
VIKFPILDLCCLKVNDQFLPDPGMTVPPMHQDHGVPIATHVIII